MKLGEKDIWRPEELLLEVLGGVGGGMDVDWFCDGSGAFVAMVGVSAMAQSFVSGFDAVVEMLS